MYYYEDHEMNSIGETFYNGHILTIVRIFKQTL